MDISKLTDKNEMAAYEYCKQVVIESALRPDGIKKERCVRHPVRGAGVKLKTVKKNCGIAIF